MPIYSWLAVAVASYTGTNLVDDDVKLLYKVLFLGCVCSS